MLYRYTVPLIATAMAFLLFVATAEDVSAISVDEIYDAWGKNCKSIETLQCEISLERIQQARSRLRPSDGDVITDAQGKVITLKRQLSIGVAGNKFSCIRRGDFWDSSHNVILPKSQQMCFDGSQSRMLQADSALPMGIIKDGTTSDHLARKHVELIAFLLFYSPIQFLNSLDEYQIENIDVTDNNSTVGDVACVELRILGRGANSSQALLYVDPIANYLPIRFVQQSKGQIRQDTLIKYVSKNKNPWMLSEWRTDFFGSSGGVKLSISGQVESCKINQPISNELFTTTFPVGTHVLHGEQTLVQAEDGELQPIANGRYGIPPNNAFNSGETNSFSGIRIAASLCVVLALIVGVYRKYRFSSD